MTSFILDAVRRGVPISDRVGLQAELREQLAQAVQQQATLSDVVAWMAQVGGMELLSIVEQDEFTSDVVLRWRADLFLVYDCT